MKIALLGYGKMGKVIEKIALEHGHEIVLKKTRDTTFKGLENADVAIDFSIPDAAVENIAECLETNVPILSGTTGWLADYNKMVALCKERNGTFMYSSNFSLGVNIFFEINDHLSKIMSKFKQYKVAIEEIHHTQKLDQPSGTAITIAETIIANSDCSNWVLKNENMNNKNESEIVITAKRIENVPGTHNIVYSSAIDTIEIKHIAHNREGFALGAIIAAEWLIEKKGVFAMKDVLDFN